MTRVNPIPPGMIESSIDPGTILQDNDVEVSGDIGEASEEVTDNNGSEDVTANTETSREEEPLATNLEPAGGLIDIEHQPVQVDSSVFFYEYLAQQPRHYNIRPTTTRMTTRQ